MYGFLSSPIIAEFLVFTILAIIRTVVLDIVLWRWLVSWMERNPWTWEYVKPFGLNVYAYSHAIMFIVSGSASYVLNRYITFRSPEVNNEVASAVTFFSINIITLVLSVFFLNWLTSSIYLKQTVSKLWFIRSHAFMRDMLLGHWPLISKIITIGVIMVLNYLGYRYLVF